MPVGLHASGFSRIFIKILIIELFSKANKLKFLNKNYVINCSSMLLGDHKSLIPARIKELFMPLASIVKISNKTRSKRIRPSKLSQKFTVKSSFKLVLVVMFLRNLVVLAVVLRFLIKM